jgi:hypothetical protein
LPDDDVRTRVRAVSHQILQGDWQGAFDSNAIPPPAAPDDARAWALQHAALEALRDVGDESSIELLRDIRTKLSNVLVQLSFQVGEEIYWRRSGGISKENFGHIGDE